MQEGAPKAPSASPLPKGRPASQDLPGRGTPILLSSARVLSQSAEFTGLNQHSRNASPLPAPPKIPAQFLPPTIDPATLPSFPTPVVHPMSSFPQPIPGTRQPQPSSAPTRPTPLGAGTAVTGSNSSSGSSSPNSSFRGLPSGPAVANAASSTLVASASALSGTSPRPTVSPRPAQIPSISPRPVSRDAIGLPPAALSPLRQSPTTALSSSAVPLPIISALASAAAAAAAAGGGSGANTPSASSSPSVSPRPVSKLANPPKSLPPLPGTVTCTKCGEPIVNESTSVSASPQSIYDLTSSSTTIPTASVPTLTSSHSSVSLSPLPSPRSSITTLSSDVVSTHLRKRYHKNCLQCVSCRTVLLGSYVTRKSEPYCISCAPKLLKAEAISNLGSSIQRTTGGDLRVASVVFEPLPPNLSSRGMPRPPSTSSNTV